MLPPLAREKQSKGRKFSFPAGTHTTPDPSPVSFLFSLKAENGSSINQCFTLTSLDRKDILLSLKNTLINGPGQPPKEVMQL
jgi:hypothetical protein